MLWIGTATALAAASEGKPQKLQRFLSPDGCFGIHIVEARDSDGVAMKEIDLVEVKSGIRLCELDTLSSQRASDIRILWSPDSHRFAFVSPERRGDWTDLWVLKAGCFEEVDLPKFPPLDLKRDRDTKTILASYSARRWIKPDVLLLDLAAEDDDGNSAHMRVELHFDADNHVTATRVDDKGH